jgi:hypothetical protein
MITASLVGQVLGVAAFGGIYLGAALHGSAHAFAATTGAISAALVAIRRFRHRPHGGREPQLEVANAICVTVLPRQDLDVGVLSVSDYKQSGTRTVTGTSSATRPRRPTRRRSTSP